MYSELRTSTRSLPAHRPGSGLDIGEIGQDCRRSSERHQVEFASILVKIFAVHHRRQLEETRAQSVFVCPVFLPLFGDREAEIRPSRLVAQLPVQRRGFDDLRVGFKKLSRKILNESSQYDNLFLTLPLI